MKFTNKIVLFFMLAVVLQDALGDSLFGGSRKNLETQISKATTIAELNAVQDKVKVYKGTFLEKLFRKNSEAKTKKVLYDRILARRQTITDRAVFEAEEKRRLDFLATEERSSSERVAEQTRNLQSQADAQRVGGASTGTVLDVTTVAFKKLPTNTQFEQIGQARIDIANRQKVLNYRYDGTTRDDFESKRLQQALNEMDAHKRAYKASWEYNGTTVPGEDF